MIKSRLRVRRVTKTITVKQKAFASGQHSESNLETGLTATYEPVASFEIVGDGGAVIVVTDVFWFEQKSDGTLPAIEEQHVLVDASSNRYEVVAVTNQAGGGNRLKVMTRSLR